MTDKKYRNVDVKRASKEWREVSKFYQDNGIRSRDLEDSVREVVICGEGRELFCLEPRISKSLEKPIHGRNLESSSKSTKLS